MPPIKNDGVNIHKLMSKKVKFFQLQKWKFLLHLANTEGVGGRKALEYRYNVPT